MARIALARAAYSFFIYGNVYKYDKAAPRTINPPIGLMALAGYLSKSGHEVTIIDGEPEFLTIEDMLERVLAFRPEIVGITATTPEYPHAYEFIKGIKERDPSIVTVLGGAHITNLPEHTIEDLGDYIDWGVLYEGEKPMAAIAGGSPEEFVWKEGCNPKLLMAEERLNGEELNSFVPDREVLDMSKYQFVDTFMGLVKTDSVEAARGCPFACTFCSSRKTLLAYRSVNSVLAELVHSARKYQTRLFMFCDDTFTINKKIATEMFRGIVKLKRQGDLPRDIHFYGFTRANTLHDYDFLELMKEAGCDRITMGVETGNPEILRKIQKGTVLDDYRKAYAMLDEVGIAKRGSFIVGHPFENRETIRDSINFAIELDLDEIGVNIMTPYPGQVTFRDTFEEKGIWLSHPCHYAEFQKDGCSPNNGIREAWKNYRSLDWHQYWKDHLRWGISIVETEALSSGELEYWHARFLQEVYGSEKMAARRQRHIYSGNTDDYWHRPWRVHRGKNQERIERERKEGMPAFNLPMHMQYTYRPIVLKDYQKSELILTPVKRERAAAPTFLPIHQAGTTT